MKSKVKIVIAMIIGFSASLLVYFATIALQRIDYFKKAFDFFRKFKPPASSETKDKRIVRRYRKHRADIKAARTRIAIFIVVTLVIFLITYIFAIAVVSALFKEEPFVKIPYMIPLVSIKQDNEYYVHILLITLFAFLQPSYLFARAARIKR